MGFADAALAEMVERVASADPTPGAGPSLAFTCAFAAALVEMVCAVSIGQQPDDPGPIEERRARAKELRVGALSLADTDAAAYREVLEVKRRRTDPGHAGRLRQALDAAADPVVAIIESAGEVTRLAADAAGQAHGGVRGEAMTAAGLGAAVVQAGITLVELNLGGERADPRLTRIELIARNASADRQRALGR